MITKTSIRNAMIAAGLVTLAGLSVAATGAGATKGSETDSATSSATAQAAVTPAAKKHAKKHAARRHAQTTKPAKPANKEVDKAGS